MKKGNRWAALLLALACAGSLAACQEKQADEPEEQSLKQISDTPP